MFLALLLVVAQLPPPLQARQPALRVLPSTSDGLRGAYPNECPPGDGGAGVAMLGSRGEAVSFTRSTGFSCTRTDGTLVSLSAGQAALSGAAVKMRAAVVNALADSEAFDLWVVDKTNLSDGGVVALPTVVANGCPYPDPGGGSTADLVSFPAIEDLSASPSGYSRVRRAFTATAVPWNGSVYLRAADATDGGTLYFDFGASGATAATAGAEWSRPERTQTLSAGARSFILGPHLGDGLGEPVSQPALSVCVWGAQAALGSTAADYCGPTGATPVQCNAETAAIHNTLADPPANPTQFCFGLDSFTPGGTAWATGTSSPAIGVLGTSRTAANSASLFLSVTTGKPVLDIFDSTATEKLVTATTAISFGTHSIFGCSDNGTLSIWVDGVSVAVDAPVGAGTGIITTQNATAYICSIGANNWCGGSWSGFRIVRGVSP